MSPNCSQAIPGLPSGRSGELRSTLPASCNLQAILEFVVQGATTGVGACGGVLRFLLPASGQVAWQAAQGRGREVTTAQLSRWERAVPRTGAGGVVETLDAVPPGVRRVLAWPLLLSEELPGRLFLLFAAARELQVQELQFVTSLATLGVCAAGHARRAERQRSRYDQLALHTEKLSALGRMAAGIAHEINNPLAGILLYSTNLVKKAPVGSQVREGLQVIIDETIRCRGIIQELLEFSRDREPCRVPSDVNEILEKAVAILENELHLHHVHLKVNLASELPRLPLDPGKIEQVFVNLLLNAQEALAGQGTIEVSTGPDPERKGFVRIEVCDTGQGIPEEQLGKIFEPFFSTKEKGTGLGLAVSYGIVRNHGGDLRAENRAEGGCRFSMLLPVEQGPRPARERS